MIWYSSDKR